jgi:hypothetical protein
VRQAARELGDDAFNVATIGFNLPFDNPAAMDHFAKQQGIDRANWKFLSPDSGSVERLTGDFGFAYAANAGGFDHVAQVTIVDPDAVRATALRRDVRSGIADLPHCARRRRVRRCLCRMSRTLLDRVRILCSVYDPATAFTASITRFSSRSSPGMTVLARGRALPVARMAPAPASPRRIAAFA